MTRASNSNQRVTTGRLLMREIGGIAARPFADIDESLTRADPTRRRSGLGGGQIADQAQRPSEAEGHESHDGGEGSPELTGRIARADDPVDHRAATPAIDHVDQEGQDDGQAERADAVDGEDRQRLGRESGRVMGAQCNP
jgi:hypothetical protein